MFRNIIKALSIILLISNFFYLKAQDYSSEVSVSHNTFYGLNDKMPFYFWANRMGQIPLSAGTLFTTQAAARASGIQPSNVSALQVGSGYFTQQAMQT
jgi:hypothetical protein